MLIRATRGTRAIPSGSGDSYIASRKAAHTDGIYTTRNAHRGRNTPCPPTMAWPGSVAARVAVRAAAARVTARARAGWARAAAAREAAAAAEMAAGWAGWASNQRLAHQRGS